MLCYVAQYSISCSSEIWAVSVYICVRWYEYLGACVMMCCVVIRYGIVSWCVMCCCLLWEPMSRLMETCSHGFIR